ncbi:MAG: hypothetical protein WCW87_02535 [Candidatus Paceibacterota bacterium]
MTDYISEIRRQMIKKYGFEEDPLKPGIPINVPNGTYPMKIDGKMDFVKITDDKISCCNLKKKKKSKKRK